GNPASDIARWDGSTWSAFGSGASAEVKALREYQTALVAGGDFTTMAGKSATSIGHYKWSGGTWRPLYETGINGPGAVALPQSIGLVSSIIVGGFQTEVCTLPSSMGIALWNGDWKTVGGGVSGVARALVTHGSGTVAGGS